MDMIIFSISTSHGTFVSTSLQKYLKRYLLVMNLLLCFKSEVF